MPTKIRAAVEDFMMQNDMSGTLEFYLGELDPQPISSPGPQTQQPQGITLPRSGGVFTPL